ncbi:hypothetical protein G5B38_09885 [Pseudohalocynthiibacter aestuariivivens]|nr:hypothetical protein [Pseudohalocynthiibacter aestuariivivens]QIE45810.1 hypothetical protein G5B38_09885 [Pseudohalocynthiibacter aestuariivivens]
MSKMTHHLVMRYFGFAVLCVALAAIGFAHRGTSAPRDPGLLAYLSAGGTLSDICGDVRGGKGTAGQGCEACRLTGAAILPEMASVLNETYLRPRGKRISAQYVYAPHVDLDLSRLTRAPPRA